MKTGTKIRRAAALLAAAALVFCLAAFAYGSPQVSADSGAVRNKLYYFSDTPVSDRLSCRDAILSTNPYADYVEIIKTAQMPLNENDLINHINNNIDTYSSITNAYVIFELNTDLKKYRDLEGGLNALNAFFANLNNLFGTLHDQLHNCRIMFICNTDEMVFAGSLNGTDYSAFLSSVDIHINTDIITLFMSGICEDLDLLQSAHIVTDFYHPNYYWYLVRYIFNRFNIPFINDIAASYSILAQNGFEFYKCNQTNPQEFVQLAFTQMSTNMPLTVENLADLLSPETNVGFIGRAQSYTPHPSYFGEAAQQVDEDHDLLLPFYALYEDENDSAAEIDGKSPLYMLGRMPADLVNDLYPVVFDDFLRGEPLAVYDNFDGVCAVTYKPVSSSEDGWIDIEQYSARTYWCIFG